MNNTIFRRKFVFGVLIALVFGFGVLGVVDAQTTNTLTFSGFRDNINLGTTTSSGINVVQARNAPNTDAIEGSFTFTVSNARDTDVITITFTQGSGTISLITPTRTGGFTDANGTTPVSISGGTITFTDPDDTDNTEVWSGRFKVDYSFTGPYGLHQITVNSDDLATSQQEIVGSTYVVQSTGNARTFEVNEINTPQENVGLGRGLTATVPDQVWTQIDFRITGGQLVLNNGDLYLQGTRIYEVTASEKTFTSLSIFTEVGGATESVTVRPNSGTTAKVTVTVLGSAADNASREITYFYGPVVLDRVSGNSQVGYSGQSLSNSLVVRVSDGGSRSRGVSGQRVTFTTSDTTANTGLSPAAGATLAPDSVQNFPATTIIILTNASGEARINYSDLSDTADAPTVTASVDAYTDTTNAAETEIFTVYTVRNPTTETITGSSTGQIVQQSGFKQSIGDNPVSVTTSATHVGVQFTITGGSLYLDPDDLDLATPNYVSNLFVSSGTNSIATAYVRVNPNSTAKVTADITGSNPPDRDDKEYVAYYFYDYANLEMVSGDNQVGNINTNLEEPFVVQVLDGTRPVSDQVVTFASATGGGTLVKDPGFPANLYDDDFDDATSPNGQVMTDANGEANVLLQMSDTAGVHTVTALFSGQTETFTAEALAPENLARIAIDSGNNQSALLNHKLDDALVVIVYDSLGRIVDDANVRFYVDASGTLVDPDPSTDPGELVTDAGVPNTVSTKTVTTDETGRASVRYNVGGTSGKRTVTAILLNDVYDSTGKSVTFTIYGTTTPSTTDPGTTTLSVIPTRITGEPGDPVSVNVTGANSNASVQISSFSLPGLASGTADGNGNVTINFNLPSTTGTHNVNVTSGGQSVPLILVVESTQTQRGSLSVSGGPFSGARGETVNVTVITSDRQNGVDIVISGQFRNSPFTKRTGSTGSTGSVSFTLAISDNAPLGNNTAQVYVDDASYSPTSFTVTVTGTSTPTPTPGTQVRLIVPSGASNRLSGAIGTNVTLRVQVVNNSTNVGVRNVDVAFRNSSGQNLSTVPTNSSGEASVTYRVRSTTETVTAVITDTDVDRSIATPIIFTISSTGDQPTTSTRLSIFQTSNTGAPGAPHALTIDLEDANGNPDPNEDVILRVTNSTGTQIGSSVLLPPTDNTGRARTPDTFRLPDTPGVYTITATSGAQTASVTVTVFAIKLVKDSNDSVSGDDQEGNRGEVLRNPFVVRVVRNNDDTAVEGVPVTFMVTDGDGELSESSSATSGDRTLTVDSDSSGNARAYLVLDEDQEDNAVRASVTGATDVTFTASGLLVPDDIRIVSGDNQQIAVNRRSAPMVVHVTDEDGNDLEGVTVSFTWRGPSGGNLTPRSAITDSRGEAEAELLPSPAGTYFVDARVSDLDSVRFTITVGDLADSIRIVSGNSQRGDPGTQLSNPLVVEVLDDDGDTVSGVTVTFRVTGGGGSLSATSVSTNSSGRAQTTLTLGDSPGGNSVRASVSGVSTPRTFSATAVDPAPPEPVIHLGAGQRSDSYWINTDSGTLHRLVGGSVEDIAPGVENVVSLVVTPDRLYWVEDTGNNSGRLRRSNLNGSNIQLIRDLTATPAGITVDTANNKIYMTNAWGKVQAINADGSSYAPNLITGLSDPKDIAVGSGKVYWITGGGTVHSANVDGSGTTQIAGGYDTLGSIAVGGGKVFWTEAISESDGNIHSANLNGTSVTEVVSLLAAPYGISVDTSANKLYFTNSRGRIMQGNLDGSGIQIVASNLVALGDVSVPSGTAAPRPPGTFSPYDVNRDGTVDNTDASLVAAALGESPPSNPRLDVNGDGMVNFLDLLLVFDNRDDTNGAPVAVAKELPNVSREEIQNQIEQLLASDNQSATAQYTLAYLQSLLEVVTPVQTRLLANYPNPFNPETWIPYQLATSSEVQITIYNSAGKEVRMLSLGHQSEGYYTDRSSAAYWDGRNAIGEAVSSGVYFYTLTTDRMSATRKMLILK